MSNYAAPQVTTGRHYAPAATIAADVSNPIAVAPFSGTVSAVGFIAPAAMTGDNTNARGFTLVNKGAAGVGTTVVATLALTTGINVVAFLKKAATLSVVANATTVVAGDVLAWVSTHTGTGIVDPGGIVAVDFSRVEGA